MQGRFYSFAVQRPLGGRKIKREGIARQIIFTSSACQSVATILLRDSRTQQQQDGFHWFVTLILSPNFSFFYLASVAI